MDFVSCVIPVFLSFLCLCFRMRYVAAYLLAVLGGNSSPSTDDIKQILGEVGVGFDDEQAKNVCSKLAGKDINEVKHLQLLVSFFSINCYCSVYIKQDHFIFF